MASEAKHTPGPWEWDEPSNWHGISARVYHVDEKGFEPIAQVQIAGWPRRIAIANARLIAAAPTLADALKELHDVGSDIEDADRITLTLQDRLIAAHTKATAALALLDRKEPHAD